jgi:hypothetical protein
MACGPNVDQRHCDSLATVPSRLGRVWQLCFSAIRTSSAGRVSDNGSQGCDALDLQEVVTMRRFQKRFRLAEARPELVAEHLFLVRHARRNRLAWTDILETARRLGEKEIGEVWEASDWRNLPRGKEVDIAALMIDGRYVIRWATPGGFYRIDLMPSHGLLVGQGDPTENIGFGTALVDKHEHVLVD